MKLREIYDYLDSISPFSSQESWDNSGLIIGDMDRDVLQVVVSLDIDEEMIDQAGEGALFVIHHPLIFGGISELDFMKYPANLIEKIIIKKQSMIAMHTNFDKTHLNRYVFEHILGFETESQESFVCRASGEWHYHTLLMHLKDRLELPCVKVVGGKDVIRSIAMTTGSGASLMDEAEADCFLTGDIKYHDAMKAVSQGLMMVDVGHFESERFFGELMGDVLKNLPVLAIITPSKNPFKVELFS
jgi:dinuclear metal center YbgI/SA1388 family protein